MRYQVVFSEHGRSHTVIFDDFDTASRFAAPLIDCSAFFDVLIFEKSESGLKEIEISD